jgi:hypothetical protein
MCLSHVGSFARSSRLPLKAEDRSALPPQPVYPHADDYSGDNVSPRARHPMWPRRLCDCRASWRRRYGTSDGRTRFRVVAALRGGAVALPVAFPSRSPSCGSMFDWPRLLVVSRFRW